LKKLLVVFTILVVLALVVFLGKERPESREIAPKAIARAAVVVATVGKGPVYRGYTAVGTIAPEERARIMPRVSGRIATLEVEEGDVVRKGDVLILIDAFDYIRAVENAVAAKNQSEANLDKAKRDYLRMERLYGDKTVSEQTYRDAKTVYELAQYAYDRALVARRTAERNLRECRVAAPISGIVTSKHVNEGELIGPQTLAFVIMQMERVEVEVDLPENAYGFMAPGSACLINIDALPHETCEGMITQIHPTIDPVSRTVKVKVSLDNPDLKLRPGMTARANVIQRARKDVLSVPKSAVIQGEEGYFVFRVLADTVEKTQVTIGIEGDDAFEVKDGLALGDQVVTRGLTGLRDGMAIRIASTPPEAHENPPT